MPAPPNDLCANALVVSSLPYTDTEDIFSATGPHAGDPNNSTNGGVPAYRGVWYKWIAPANPPLMMADLSGSQPFTGSGGSSQGLSFLCLGVFTGACGGPWTQIAAYTAVYTLKNGVLTGDGPARVSWQPIAGTTYWFNVGTKSSSTIGQSDTANLVFNLFAQPAAPVNDLCVNAIVVPPLPYTDTSRLCYAATPSVDDPVENLVWGSQLDQSVWYKFVAPANLSIKVNSHGSDFSPTLAVWSTGACGTLGGELDGEQGNVSPDFVDTEIDFNVVQGQTYYVEAGFTAGGDPWGMGNLTLTWSSGAPVPPPNPPTGFTATPIDTYGGISLSWTPPASGTAVDYYLISYCQGAGCSSFSLSVKATGTSIQLLYLGNQQPYRFQIQAVSLSYGSSTVVGPISATSGTQTSQPCVPRSGLYRQDFGGCIGTFTNDSTGWGSGALMARTNAGLIAGFGLVTQSGVVGNISDDGSIPADAAIDWVYAQAWSSFARRFDGLHSPGFRLIATVTLNGQVEIPSVNSGTNPANPDVLTTPVCAGGSVDVAAGGSAAATQSGYGVPYTTTNFGVRTLNVPPSAEGGLPPYYLNNPVTGLPWQRADLFAVAYGWIVGWDGGDPHSPGDPHPEDGVYITPDVQVDRLIVSVRWHTTCTAPAPPCAQVTNPALGCVSDVPTAQGLGDGCGQASTPTVGCASDVPTSALGD